MTYRRMYNTFFRDLPQCPPLYSSLLTVKSVNLVVAHDGFLCVMEIVCIFHCGYLDYRGSYHLKLKYPLPFLVSYVQLVTQQYESRTCLKNGAHGTIVCFIVITDVQFLICTAV